MGPKHSDRSRSHGSQPDVPSVPDLCGVAESSSWVPSPSCPLPGRPFPIMSLALSARVSPRTLLFQALDKSPLSGCGRGPPSCNSCTLRYQVFIQEVQRQRKGVRRQLCAPASSDSLSCAFSLSILPSLALKERCISQTLPVPFLYVCLTPTLGFPGGSDSKESACNAGDQGSIPGSGRSPGEGNGNPLQCSCLENPMDRGACQDTGHGVAKSQT